MRPQTVGVDELLPPLLAGVCNDGDDVTTAATVAVSAVALLINDSGI